MPLPKDAVLALPCLTVFPAGTIVPTPQSRLMLLRWVAATVLLSVVPLAAGAVDPALARYERVAIAPTKTSIYIGSVSMTMPPFVRRDTVYESTYAAKVFPYFFYNEQGRLSITVPDDSLRRLERGEPIDFQGVGVSRTGVQRHVEGRATPIDARHGTIKVRVFVSKRIQLIFNTTYEFPPTDAAMRRTP